MESSSSKKVLEQERQAELRRQIAALQAQLGDPGNIVSTPPPSPKRKATSAGLMVPATPSPSTCATLIVVEPMRWVAH